jgi:hypothetical protein
MVCKILALSGLLAALAVGAGQATDLPPDSTTAVARAAEARQPVSVIEFFETDGGVNYRSDRLI